MRTRSLIAILTLFLMFQILLDYNSAAARPLRAVASFSVLADLIENVGQEHVVVTSIVPIGSDPHSWEATPREARTVAAADILFYNGMALETWVDRLVRNSARPDLPVIVLSDGLSALPSATFGSHIHQGGDPHLWLDVRNAMDYVKRIIIELSNLDPEYASYYQKNGEAYLAELETLDRWLRDLVKGIPEENRYLLTYHDAFGYLAHGYGLEVKGFLVAEPDREPTARDMVNLSRMLAELPRKVVFVEPQVGVGHRYADILAQETGARVYSLFSDSLTLEVGSYLEMMYRNGQVLEEALR